MKNKQNPWEGMSLDQFLEDYRTWFDQAVDGLTFYEGLSQEAAVEQISSQGKALIEQARGMVPEEYIEAVSLIATEYGASETINAIKVTQTQEQNNSGKMNKQALNLVLGSRRPEIGPY